MRYVLFSFLFLASFGSAQSQYSLTRFDLAQLSAIPGEVKTSTNFSAILKFEAAPQTKITARSDLISVELQNDLIIVRANVPSGSTDLTVPVAGKIARFTVVIDESITHSNYYEITSPEPVQLGEVEPQETTPPPDTTGATESSPNSTSEKPFLFTLTPSEDNPKMFQYSLESYSPYYLIADGQQLSITTRDGQNIPYTLSTRHNDSGMLSRIAPRHEEAGTLILADVPTEPATLTWTIVETITAQTFTLEMSLPLNELP
jgi:hypothetical protein